MKFALLMPIGLAGNTGKTIKVLKCNTVDGHHLEQVSQLKQGLADRTAKTAVSVAI